MKKSLTSVLVLALVASMGVTAFAATNDGTAGTDITVNGTYEAADAPAEKISVDIAWDAMDFTYTGPSKGTWNPKTHQYENPTAGGWSTENGTDPKITVTNHSNIPVKTAFAFNGTVEGVNGSFTNDSLVLATAENTPSDNAPKDETTFSLAGEGIDADKTLGTITVTVAKEAGGSDTPSGITTFEALQEAVNAGGIVTLGADITLSDYLNIYAESPLILDLNGHTITGVNKGVWLKYGTCTIQGGSIIVIGTGGIAVYNGNLTIDQCTISSSSSALSHCHSSAVTTVKNSELIRTDGSTKSVVFLDAGTASFEGTVNVTGIIYGNATCLAGTYNFDPTSYVDTTLYDITQNTETGTWTVTAK